MTTSTAPRARKARATTMSDAIDPAAEGIPPRDEDSIPLGVPAIPSREYDDEQPGHAAPLPVPLDAPVQELALVRIDEHPQNTRHTYDQPKLQELADSIRARGLITPVLVRPLGNTGRYQLLAGHRRCRAARMAGLTHVLAVVRVMDDHAALEVLMIENLQREDIHPLDMAQGFRALLDDGYEVATIAEKIGKSAQYVYARLQLLELGVAAREAFVLEYVPLSHAIELAKVPREAQEQALREQFRVSVPKLLEHAGATLSEAQAEEVADDDEDAGEAYEDDDTAAGPDATGRLTIATPDDPFVAGWEKPRVPRLAELRAWLHREHYRGLDRVPWQLADASLLSSAGACSSCPKRSGAAPELFAELTSTKDACIDATCFAAKHSAFLTRALEEAKTAHPGARVASISSTYYSADKSILTKGNFWEVKEGTEGALVGVWIDGPGFGTTSWITTTPPKSRDRVEGGPSGNHRIDDANDGYRERARKQAAADKKKREKALRGRDAVVRAILAATPADAIAAGEWGKAQFVAVLDEIHHDAMIRLAKYVAVDTGKQMGAEKNALITWATTRATRVELARAFVFALLGDESTIPTYSGRRAERLDRFAKLAKVNVQKVTAAAEQEAAKATPKRAPAKKAAAKKSGTKRAAKPAKKAGARR